jgi:hypothetical protein
MEFYDGAARLVPMSPQQRKQEVENAWAKGGRPDGNPWHPNMDGKIFRM